MSDHTKGPRLGEGVCKHVHRYLQENLVEKASNLDKISSHCLGTLKVSDYWGRGGDVHHLSPTFAALVI